MKCKFIGYIKNESIYSGMMIPVFYKDGNYYTQSLSENNRIIDGFDLLEITSLENICFVDKKYLLMLVI